jgi:hypothetical protein
MEIKKTKNFNLKPLQPDIHKTNRWNFRGKNLSNLELKKLASNGVAEVDWMPDNRLKLPKFRQKWRTTTIRQPSMSAEDFEKLFAKFQSEYDDLETPKPNMFDWFAYAHPEIMLKELLRNILMTKRGSDADKASRTILEFGKQKPKTVTEFGESAEPFTNMSPTEILDVALEMCGLKNKFRQFLESNPESTIN